MTTPSELLALMPFAETVGVVIDTATPDEAVGHLDWAPERCTGGAALHGGAIMTLADTLGGVCAYLNLPPEASTATTNSTTSMFRGLRSGRLTATSRPLHVGRTLIVVQTELTDDAGRAVAQVMQTQAVLPG